MNKIEIIINLWKADKCRWKILENEKLLKQCYLIKCLENGAYHYSWEEWVIEYLGISVRKYRAILRKWGAKKLLYEKYGKEKEKNLYVFTNKKNAEKCIGELETYYIMQKLCL